ncbi:hypothetical protein [Streptomyces sp. NPDC007905]|uniref:hypothetical protein n=1 Tax=Streptomyces sp. NPDC007905 TaxID=3364788 RepID=UPI0036E88CCF
MHTIKVRAAAGLLGAVALGLFMPVRTFADVPAAPESARFCGVDGASGLGVSAAPNVPCATALRVAAAYTEVRHGPGDASVHVRAGGATWTCQERQGDPNPYQECLNTGDSGRRVVLSS